MLGFAAGDFENFESCGFQRFCGQTLRLSILLDAGGRPVLRNTCKITKFVDKAENEPKEVYFRFTKGNKQNKQVSKLIVLSLYLLCENRDLIVERSAHQQFLDPP